MKHVESVASLLLAAGIGFLAPFDTGVEGADWRPAHLVALHSSPERPEEFRGSATVASGGGQQSVPGVVDPARSWEPVFLLNGFGMQQRETQPIPAQQDSAQEVQGPRRADLQQQREEGSLAGAELKEEARQQEALREDPVVMATPVKEESMLGGSVFRNSLALFSIVAIYLIFVSSLYSLLRVETQAPTTRRSIPGVNEGARVTVEDLRNLAQRLNHHVIPDEAYLNLVTRLSALDAQQRSAGAGGGHGSVNTPPAPPAYSPSDAYGHPPQYGAIRQEGLYPNLRGEVLQAPPHGHPYYNTNYRAVPQQDLHYQQLYQSPPQPYGVTPSAPPPSSDANPHH